MKKKMIMISPTPTHPQNAGNRERIFQISKVLKEMNYEIYFIYLRGLKQAEDDDLDDMRKHFNDRVSVLSYEELKRNLPIRKRASMDDWYEASFDREIREIAKQIQPDIVMVEYAALSKALDSFDSSVVKILDTLDCFTNWNEKLVAHGINATKWFSFTRGEESVALNRADIVFAVNEQEQNIFREMTQTEIVEVGHLMNLKKLPFEKSDSNSIVFVGSKSPIVKKNIDFFLQTMFAKVKNSIPDVKLTLVGGICELVEETSESICKVGEVDNLELVYEKARVVINSDIFGTGISIKSLTALGYGKPLVTTAYGARGLGEKSEEAYLLRDFPDDFAQAVVSILRNDSRARSLSNKAYEYACQYREQQMMRFALAISSASLLSK